MNFQHHQSLVTNAVTVSKMEMCFVLSWCTTWEDFTVCIHHKDFRPYIILNLRDDISLRIHSIWEDFIVIVNFKSCTIHLYWGGLSIEYWLREGGISSCPKHLRPPLHPLCTPDFIIGILMWDPLISVGSTHAEPKVTNPCPPKLGINIMLSSLWLLTAV